MALHQYALPDKGVEIPWSKKMSLQVKINETPERHTPIKKKESELYKLIEVEWLEQINKE